MIRRMLILVCVVALVFPLTLAGCNMNESARLKAAFGKNQE